MMGIIRHRPSSFNVLNTNRPQGLSFHTLLSYLGIFKSIRLNRINLHIPYKTTFFENIKKDLCRTDIIRGYTRIKYRPLTPASEIIGLAWDVKD